MGETRKKHFKECFHFTSNNISKKLKEPRSPEGLATDGALGKAP